MVTGFDAAGAWTAGFGTATSFFTTGVAAPDYPPEQYMAPSKKALCGMRGVCIPTSTHVAASLEGAVLFRHAAWHALLMVGVLTLCLFPGRYRRRPYKAADN